MKVWSVLGGRTYPCCCLARRQRDDLDGQVRVGDQAQQVRDAVEAGATLVVASTTVPGRLLDVRRGETSRPSASSTPPSVPGTGVHGAQLPALGAVLDAPLKAALLLLVADREPVLSITAGAHQASARTAGQGAQELPVSSSVQKPITCSIARPVVPAPIEEHHPLRRPGRVRRRSAGSDHWVSCAPVGVASATHLGKTLGLRHSVIRLIVPPLPAASRPSNSTTTLRPSALIHSWSFDELDLQPGQLALVALAGQLGFAAIVVCRRPPADRGSFFSWFFLPTSFPLRLARSPPWAALGRSGLT